jgi:hypothetical protein
MNLSTFQSQLMVIKIIEEWNFWEISIGLCLAIPVPYLVECRGLGIRGSRFLIYNFIQFAIDGKNNSQTKIEKVFFFIFMSSYAEMSFFK